MNAYLSSIILLSLDRRMRMFQSGKTLFIDLRNFLYYWMTYPVVVLKDTQQQHQHH